MDEKVLVVIRLNDSLIPALAVVAPSHLSAVQRIVTPLVFGYLQQLFARAEAETKAVPKALICTFQDHLGTIDSSTSVNTLVVPNESLFVSALFSAFYSRVHVLAAADPLFCGGSSSTKKNEKHKIRASCTPRGFLTKVLEAASKVLFQNPFVFLKDVDAQRFVERQQKCMAEIDRLVDYMLYDRCNEMVARLGKECRQSGSGIEESSFMARKSLHVSEAEQSEREADKSIVASRGLLSSKRSAVDEEIERLLGGSLVEEEEEEEEEKADNNADEEAKEKDEKEEEYQEEEESSKVPKVVLVGWDAEDGKDADGKEDAEGKGESVEGKE